MKDYFTKIFHSQLVLTNIIIATCLHISKLPQEVDE